MRESRFCEMRRVALLALFVPLSQAYAWDPPIGIPRPSFGIEENVSMYKLGEGETCSSHPDKCYDFGAGPEPYKLNSLGDPYTHYVNSGSGCTNTGNAFGTEASPRCSIPATLPAGSVIEVHGGPFTGGQLILTASGTAEKPCWFRGSSASTRPVIRRETIPKGSYIILENLHYDTYGYSVGLRSHTTSDLHHAALRHSEVPNVAVFGNTTYTFHDIVIYDNHIHADNFTNLGPDSPAFPENDVAGVGTGSYSQDVWIVDNDIHDVSGDSVGTAHAANYTARNYYVGRNKLHDTGENAVDFKEIENVVVSQNEMYNIYGPSSGSDGACVVIHYGPVESPRNAWIIFNEIHTCLDTGIQIGGDVTDPVYVIGNIIYGVTNPSGSATGIVSWNSSDIYIAGNILYGNDSGIDITGAQDHTLYLHNNIIANNRNLSAYHLTLDFSPYRNNADLKTNLFYQAGGSVRINQGDDDNVAAYIARTGKCTDCLEVNPKFALAAANDFRLQADSPAIDRGDNTLMDQLAVAFNNSFGTDIRKDFSGIARPQDGNGDGSLLWDIGATEHFAGSPVEPSPFPSSTPGSSPSSSPVPPANFVISPFKNIFNPHKGQLTIPYSPAGTAAVTAAIYDRQGRKVRELGDAERSGDSLLWNGKNENGNVVASGVYVVMIKSGSSTLTKRVVVVK